MSADSQREVTPYVEVTPYLGVPCDIHSPSDHSHCVRCGTATWADEKHECPPAFFGAESIVRVRWTAVTTTAKYDKCCALNAAHIIRAGDLIHATNHGWACGDCSEAESEGSRP